MKPDGLLILGVPHFVEVFWPLLHLLAPRVTGGHNRFALSVEHWTVFEQPLGLKPVRKSYLGGFEPWLINSVVGEEYASYGGRFKPLGRLLMRCLGLGLAVRHRVLRAIPSLGKTPTFDGKLLSAYAMAAYILTRQTHAQPVPH